METSLHRELKQIYAGSASAAEVRVGRYRIDAVVGSELVEIQHGGLAALRRKVGALVAEHDVRVVKPLVETRMLMKCEPGRAAPVQRRSPKRGQLIDVFHELLYFKGLFPHPRLTVELLVVDVEEWRRAGHGKRRRWRRNDFVVEDRRLLRVHESYVLRTPLDLWRLACGTLPPKMAPGRDAIYAAERRELLDARRPATKMPKQFDTGELAVALGIDRWFAQRVAYCLRNAGSILDVGKRGNARLYSLPPRSRKRAA